LFEEAPMHRRALTVALAWVAAAALHAQPVRTPVLRQIELPHSYYYRELYLPQLTSGPSWVCWMPDGQSLVYSMQGTLWRQRLGGEVAEQLTDDAGADYQPDCSPDGRSVAFVRYDGRSLELMHLDLGSREVRALTADGAVSVEPRWSPDGRRLAFVSTAGTGHFLLQLAAVEGGRIQSSRTLVADRRSSVARYYYSAFDHAINPTWTRDGRAGLRLESRGRPRHGRHRSAGGGRRRRARPVLHEETSWHARPDVSPDGSRIVYSSYLTPAAAALAAPLRVATVPAHLRGLRQHERAGPLTAGRSRSSRTATATRPCGSSTRGRVARPRSASASAATFAPTARSPCACRTRPGGRCPLASASSTAATAPTRPTTPGSTRTT
jgi:hypothetical protein